MTGQMERAFHELLSVGLTEDALSLSNGETLDADHWGKIGSGVCNAVTRLNTIKLSDRAVFTWVSKVISQLLWFCIATLCDWLKKISRHSLYELEVKPKLIMTCLHAIFRAWRRLHVSALSSDWFIELSFSVLIVQRNYFGKERTAKQAISMQIKM